MRVIKKKRRRSLPYEREEERRCASFPALTKSPRPARMAPPAAPPLPSIDFTLRWTFGKPGAHWRRALMEEPDGERVYGLGFRVEGLGVMVRV